jgi:SET domain-containing protein
VSCENLSILCAGDFVIEYVGEMIDEAEYQRRMTRKHEEKDENYYFLTIDKDRMLDAGPKGNVAR